MTIQPNSGAISNGEYLAWMAEHTGGLYDEMRVAMDLADQRSDLVERLADLRARLGALPAGAQNTEPEGWDALCADMERLLEGSAGSPEHAELEALLRPMLDAMIVSSHEIDLPAVDDVEYWIAPSRETVSSWSDQLQARIDTLHKDDQMALINIQDLNAQIQQATQLASALVASSNQSLNAVIGNIRG